ncbi:serine/threonine-protein kinase [Streptomyces sp. NRRL S-31]|uniref:serine/threonine-protein kinase n=1 Tax=Streptomyces sp. NRRL S-31 TaxID=1463898 RepID=UPI00069B705F|nr:serine/threonine-protein kinase [Streptomyces sp. NRRL S-31]
MVRRGDVLDGRYRLDEELGRGGFGTAWRAHDLRIGRPVAVKIGAAETREAARRLFQEAELAGNLAHPNIAVIHDVGTLERDGGPAVYIVMELVPGEDLSTVLARGLPPFDRAVDWARQICAALAAAHDAGIVHRDIKPANLILTGTGTVKVLDFGIARRHNAHARLTADGLVIGTVAYTAPERLLGGPVDGRSDLYALGCVLSELWTGHGPFSAVTPDELIDQHRFAPPRRPSALRPGLPPGADRLVLGLLAKDPAQRPPDAREVGRQLRLLTAGTTTPAATVTAPLPAPPYEPTATAAPPPAPPYEPVAGAVTDPVRGTLRRRLGQIVALPPDADREEYLGLLDALIPEAQRELGPDGPLTTEAMLARALRADGPALSRIVPKLIRVFGPEDRRTILARARDVGRSVYDGERQLFAELEEIIALATRVLGPHDPVTLLARLDLAEGSLVTRAPAGPVHLPLMPYSRGHAMRRRAAYEPLLPDLARGLPADSMRYEALLRVAIDAHVMEDHEVSARHYDELAALARTLRLPPLGTRWGLQHARSVGEAGDPERAMTMLDELLTRHPDPDFQYRVRRLRSRFRRRARRQANGAGGGRGWFGLFG